MDLKTFLDLAGLGTFFVLIGTILYNRIMTWKRINERTMKLEAQFLQYQVDMRHYLEICELCRGEVRKHHEDEVDRHVTPDMREQIKTLVVDVRDIKNHLMERPAIAKH